MNLARFSSFSLSLLNVIVCIFKGNPFFTQSCVYGAGLGPKNAEKI